MAHCVGRNYTSSGAGQWYKFIHTSSKDDTRCIYCYNKLVALGRTDTHGMEQYVSKTNGKINCDTYRRALSRMVYNDVIVSVTSADGNIPYIRYNKETADLEKHGIYCVEMAYGTEYSITISVKDYLYKYFVKTVDSTSTCDTMAFYTNERTLDVMTSSNEPIAITVFKYTKCLQLTSAATILIKTIPSNPIVDMQVMHQSQELLLSNKLSRLNEYLANANLLGQQVEQPMKPNTQEPTNTPTNIPTNTQEPTNTLTDTPTLTQEPTDTLTQEPTTQPLTPLTDTPNDYVEL